MIRERVRVGAVIFQIHYEGGLYRVHPYRLGGEPRVGQRFLASSVICARALTPVGSKMIAAFGKWPSRVEWWARPDVAKRIRA
jgi:hypothetical protein